MLFGPIEKPHQVIKSLLPVNDFKSWVLPTFVTIFHPWHTFWQESSYFATILVKFMLRLTCIRFNVTLSLLLAFSQNPWFHQR